MARKFNGSSDRVIVNDALRRPNWFTDDYSIAVWVKGAAQANTGIYSEGNSASNTNFWWIGPDSTATSKMRWSSTNGPTPYVTAATVFDNTWHHYAFVCTNHTFWVYVDGVLDNTPTNVSSGQGGAGTGLNLATIGALSRTTNGSFFTGLIAHLGVWGVPLNAEQVRMLARGTRLPSELEPQNYWPLTAPDANIAQSLGRRHNHGTLVGTTFSADVPPLVGRPQPALWQQRYARWRVPQLALPFINSVSALYTPTLIGQVAVPFISSVTTLYTPSIAAEVDVPFISSVTALYTPTLTGQLAVPFIGSATALYTPALTSASVEVDVPFISSVTVVYAPGVPHQVTSGELALAADDVTVAPITVTPGSLFLTGDDLQVSGPYAATFGVLSLTADNPSTAGPIVPTSSGVLLIRGDSPLVAGGTQPTTGRFVLTGDAPTIYPVAAQSGKLVLAATGPTVQPVPSTSGRFIMAATGPTVYPITTDSGRLLLRADGPQIFHVGIVLEGSGILRLRSDVPVITPLTEPPPPPPPPPPGTGLAVSATV